jgi:hypothetical protein
MTMEREHLEPAEGEIASTRTVMAVFRRLDEAQAVASELVDAGIPAGNVSVVSKAGETQPQYGAGETKAGAGAAVGAGAGAVIGGVLALASLAVPGIGPLLAIGPLAAALSGAASGAAMGGLFGSIVGLGVPKEHARHYENAVRSGGVLVAVEVPDRPTADRVSSLLARRGADELTDFTSGL